MVHTCWCPNQVMHVHDGQPSCDRAGVDPGNFQRGLVNEAGMNGADSPYFRGEPRLDEQHPARVKMTCHTLDSSGKIVEGFYVPDGTKETGHRVKCTSEIEMCHVCLM